MATKDKAQKKAKLRHAEYYDFQEIQDKLYADSLKGREFKHLLDIITLPVPCLKTYVWHTAISSQIVEAEPQVQTAGQSRTWKSSQTKN